MIPLISHPCPISGGTKRATSVNASLLRPQSSEGKCTTSRGIEPERRSFRGHGSCTFTEVARLVPSGYSSNNNNNNNNNSNKYNNYSNNNNNNNSNNTSNNNMMNKD